MVLLPKQVHLQKDVGAVDARSVTIEISGVMCSIGQLTCGTSGVKKDEKTEDQKEP
jgi:hypothetical protein